MYVYVLGVCAHGQGSNPRLSNDPSHSSDEVGSLTCWATRELLLEYSRVSFHPSVLQFPVYKVGITVPSHRVIMRIKSVKTCKAVATVFGALMSTY